MKWRAYPKYKDSGIKWLREIPDEWSVAPLKRGLARNDGGVCGEDFDDDGTIVLRSTEIALDGSWQIEEPAHRQLTAKERRDGRLEVGDLLVTKSSGSARHLGKTAVVTEDVAAMNCCFSNFTQRLRVNTKLLPRCLFWILNCPVGRDQLVFLGMTTTGLANLNIEVIGAVQIPFSTLAEQRAIAAFLDRETERIDALIARKERQIELLQEKRAALISHAVTKGLDPNAPMKHSGVEWLGEIPKGWESLRLKYLIAAPLQYGANEPAELDDPDLPRYVRITDINGDGTLREDTFKSLPEDTAKPYFLEQGNLLFARSGATVGKTFLYQESWGRAAYAGYLIRARIRREKMYPEFAA